MPYSDGNPTLGEQIEEDMRRKFYTEEILAEAQDMDREIKRLRMLAAPFVGGFKSDPGTSDLDNEQPIIVRVTLGDWRRLRAALAKDTP